MDKTKIRVDKWIINRWVYALLLTSVCLLFKTSLDAQEITVVLRVNMNYQVELGEFNAAVNFVDVAGTFNGWDGVNHRLSDLDQDGIYEIAIDGFKIGDFLEFKFRIDGVWDGREEFPGGGSNRQYSVVQGVNEILVYYNDEIPPGEGFFSSFSASVSNFYAGGIVEFTNRTAGEFDSQSWIFEGGLPTTSALSSPHVKYSESGSFDVTLIIQSGDQSDTLTFLDFINVKPRSEEEIEWWNDAIFYEVFVRSFYDSNGDGVGDFKGLLSKLDYLNDGDPNTTHDLGITGLWLMPIHPSPSYHGYDVTDYLGIHPDYGTMDDFKTFLDAAHERGIRVIIDFVMNHTSAQHPWFMESSQSVDAARRNWYRWSGVNPGQSGPWGQQVWYFRNNGYFYGLFWSGMPDLNYSEPQVKESMFEAAAFWLNEVGIDGFRLDAVKFIFEDGNQLEDTESTFEFWKEYQTRIKEMKEDALSVGEAWTNTEQILSYVEDGGLDMCFEFDLAGSIINSVNTQSNQAISDQAQKAYSLYPDLQYGTFLTNHDMDRVIENLGNSTSKMKTAAALYLSLPGTPFIYYGEEIGMKGVKPDEFIRRPMQWTSEMGAGFTSGVPWIALNSNYRTNNVEGQTADQTSLLSWYRQLIHLRNRETTLRKGDFNLVFPTDSRVAGFVRKYDGEEILVLINLSDSQIASLSINASLAALTEGTKSFTNLITQTTLTLDISSDGMVSGIDLAQREVQFLKYAQSTSTHHPPLKNSWLKVVPNPSSDYIVIDASGIDTRHASYSIYNSTGRLIGHGLIEEGGLIPTGDLQSGHYLFRVQGLKEIIVTSFIKI